VGALRRAFTVAWLLLKNKRIHWMLLINLALAVLFIVLEVAAPPPARRGAMPLTKREAAEWLGAALSVTLALSVLLAARGCVLIDSEAERELLLANPVSLREYFCALALRDSLAPLSAIFSSAALAFAINGGNAAKALLLAPLLAATSTILSFVPRASSILSLNPRWRLALRAATAAYLVVSALHSLATRAPSPLLSAPLAFAARPIVLCFTITETAAQVALEGAPLVALAAALLPLNARLGDLAHPEHFKLSVELGLEPEREGGAPIYGSPRSAIYRVLLVRPLASPAHVGLLVLAVPASLLLGLLARALVPPLPQRQGGLWGFTTGFLFSALNGVNVSVVAAALGPLWVYRVNAADMKSVANAVALRLEIHYAEAILMLSLFLAVGTGRAEYLLAPLAALPACSGSAVATLALLAYVMPKKRLVRRTEAGLTMLEETVHWLLFAGSLVLLVPLIVFLALVEVGSPWVLHYALAPTPLALLVHWLGVEFASELLYSRDVAS